MSISSVAALLTLASVHLLANQAQVIGIIWHGRFLSFAAGISFAYVFVDLLPTLELEQPVLKETFAWALPYLDRHAYLIALLGVLFFYGMHASAEQNNRRNFWLSIAGTMFFNFFVGISLTDTSNPDIQPLYLFTIALGMHYFVNDHNVATDAPALYQREARWWLIGALFAGFAVGSVTHLPNALEAIVISFLAGGVLLNVLRYELPKRAQIGYAFFVLGSLVYTAILLKVGSAPT